MTDLDLNRLREIAEAADHPTETPWGTHDRGIGFEVVWRGDHGEGEGPFRVSLFDDDVASRVNAEHIAAFDPPTVLAMINEIERLRGAHERAWWWEEADEDYVFSAGEPYRRERVDGVLETKEALVRGYIRVRGYAKVFRFFRDTRWTPPVKPLRADT